MYTKTSIIISVLIGDHRSLELQTSTTSIDIFSALPLPLSLSRMFNTFKPTCVKLSQLTFNVPVTQWDQDELYLQLVQLDNELSFKSLSSKNDLTNGSDQVNIPSNLIDYIMIPLAKIIIQFESLNIKIIIKLLSILNKFCIYSWIYPNQLNLNLATNIFPFINHLSQSIIDKNKNNNNPYVFRLIIETFSNFIQSVNNQMYGPHFFSTQSSRTSNNTNDNTKYILLSNLSNLISIQLNILSNSNDNLSDSSLQLLIIDNLINLYQNNLNFDNGETLSNILPGNVSNLIKFMIKPKTNYKCIIKSIDLLEFLIITIYSDSTLKQIEIDQATKTNHRDKKWLFATREQVKLAINQCFPVLIERRRNHYINLSICKFITSCFRSCYNSIVSICQDDLIKYLIQCKYDSFDSIYLNNQQLKDSIRYNIHKYLTQLISDIDTNINLNQTNNIELINFILKLNFNSDINNTGRLNSNLLNKNIVDKIFLKLIQSVNVVNQSLLENDPFQTKVIQTLQSVDNITNINQDNLIIRDSANSIFNPYTTYMNKNNNERINNKLWSKDMESEITSLLHYIGEFIHFDPYSIQMYLQNAEVIKVSLSCQNSALWMILNLLPNKITNDNDNNSTNNHSLKSNSFTDSFLTFNDDDDTSDNVDLQTNIEDSCLILLEYSINLLQQEEIINNFNVLSYEQERLISIVIQVIERSCQLMGLNFENELIDYLYLVVSHLSSSSPMIRFHAHSCINTLSRILYQGSIYDLIVNNVDYLIESISQRLNMGMTHHVTTVLMVICKMTGYEIILSFNDILETIFQILDYYHGYQELCLQIFQLFEVIVNEMNKKYLSNNESNPKLDSNYLNNNSFKPWGCTNKLQFFSLLKKSLPLHNSDNADNIDSNDKDLPFGPNEPKSFQEYFESKLKVQEIDDKQDSYDSDDEEESTMDDKSKNEEENEWVSPIPRQSYRLLIQILQYGDRLLTHNSKPLRIQILKVMKLIIPMLSTQYDSLLPQVAQAWDSVTQCLFDKDYSIINAASLTTETIITFSQDFISRRFIELWDRLKTQCPLLLIKEININRNNIAISDFAKTQRQVGERIQFPAMTRTALISMSNMLLKGVSLTEYTLGESNIKDIITYCLSVIPPDIIKANSMLLGDIIYTIQNQI